MELVGEYVGQDEEPQRLRVLCDESGDADPLQGLLSGVAQMKELVSEFFGPLVQREAQDPAAAPGRWLDGDDEDDTEDENSIDNRNNSDGPSAKRPKPPS